MEVSYVKAVQPYTCYRTQKKKEKKKGRRKKKKWCAKWIRPRLICSKGRKEGAKATVREEKKVEKRLKKRTARKKKPGYSIIITELDLALAAWL